MRSESSRFHDNKSSSFSFLLILNSTATTYLNVNLYTNFRIFFKNSCFIESSFPILEILISDSVSDMKKIKPSHSFLVLVSSISVLLCNPIACDPQINLVKLGCSQYNASDPSAFFSALNATFSDIRSRLTSARFATAQRPEVYTLFQCRGYLSASDCLSCFSEAEHQIRNCSDTNGARVVYDGCYLRYESKEFFTQTTLTGEVLLCGWNGTESRKAGLEAAVKGLLADLCKATPRIEGFFSAGKREAGEGDIVYGVAQCAPTVGRGGCEECLNVAYGNIKGCPPELNGRAFDASCFLRYSDTAFFSDNQTTDLAPFLQTTGGSSQKKAIVAGVVGGVTFLLLLFLLLVIVRRLKKIQNTRRGEIIGATELRGPKTYHYNDLKFATKNFCGEYKLGEGGFGDVYKGVLRNGNTVAVKKLMIGQSPVVKANFESEVKLIGNVNHRNLVRLLGCCNKGPELLLVYEYMANASLDRFLFGNRQRILTWKERFDIIVGTARGLAYLHDEFHARIIHRDIKSSNILLGDDFQPKIADFGLVRLLPADQSHLSTRFAGTLGYTAPEYAMHGQLSEKVDTYSYGVVVLEIISGRKCSHIQTEPVTQYLLEWAWRLYEEDLLMELVDESLDPNEYSTEEVKKVIEIALMCTQSPVSRPTMSDVVVLLLSRGGLSLNLHRPAFIDANNNRIYGRVQNDVRSDNSTSTSSSTSNAILSFSQFSAR